VSAGVITQPVLKKVTKDKQLIGSVCLLTDKVIK
jgi:hypothetical protein